MPILEWLGKNEAIRTTDKIPYRVLKVNEELSYGEKTKNMIIKGDNLEALKALLPYYKGQVKCIYIDPPYNTGSRIDADGNEVGYDDNLEHSTWCSMMYPRIELLRKLLREDGLIAVQIDDDEYCHLYMIIAEIFGMKNVKTISVKMSEATGVKMASINKNGSIPKLKEYIILASPNGIKNLHIEKVPKEKWDNEYKTVCLNVTEKELNFVKAIIADEDRTKEDIQKVKDIVKKISFMNVKDVCKAETGNTLNDAWLYQNAYRIVQIATLTGGARNLAEEIKQTTKDDIAVFPIVTSKNKMYLIKRDFNELTDLPRCKLLFADLYLTVHPGDFWQDIKTTGLDNEGGVTFKKGKKPEALIKRIVGMSTEKDDIVLDSFAGSGTTCAVAHKMNRKYIGIEQGNHIYSHVIKRLNSVIDGEQQGISKSVNWQGGGGYTFYDLGEPIFDENGNINQQVDFKTLASHIWFSETKTAYTDTANSPNLGEYNNTQYYLLYNGILGDKKPDGGNVLTQKVFDILPKYDGKKVIYGEATTMSAEKLKQNNIIFKQTPYEIKAK